MTVLYVVLFLSTRGQTPPGSSHGLRFVINALRASVRPLQDSVVDSPGTGPSPLFPWAFCGSASIARSEPSMTGSPVFYAVLAP